MGFFLIDCFLFKNNNKMIISSLEYIRLVYNRNWNQLRIFKLFIIKKN